MKLVIASNNAHKVAEIKAILAPYFDEILSLRDAGITIDVVEDGDTFEANARKKAEEVLAVAAADAVLSDDSGLMVDALGGAPGVYSARYAGEGHDDAANNAKLLEAMQNVPDDARTCRFVSAIALARRGRETLVRLGKVEGTLLRAPRGTSGFGYDPLFYYVPTGKTFAELDASEKNLVSHRKRGLEAVRAALEEERA
ncbi:MAG: XTP/dITP diphosphatase [bacterium]|nr:XTP/dITP diphosphatase [bacterium]